jgi:hypothetical protein
MREVIKNNHFGFQQIFCLFIISLFLISSINGIACNYFPQSMDYKNNRELNLTSDSNRYSSINLSNGLLNNIGKKTLDVLEKNKPKYRYSDTFKKNEILFSLSDISSEFLFLNELPNKKWYHGGVAGAPLLPMRKYRLLLPPNSNPNDVSFEILNSSAKEIIGKYEILSAPYPTTQLVEEIIIAKSNELALFYQQNCFWPESFIHSFKVQQMRSAIIVEFEYYPFQYNPVTKTVIQNYEVDLSIKWAKQDNSLEADPLTKKFLEKYEFAIDNYEEMIPYYQTTDIDTINDNILIESPHSDIPRSTYLIITTNAIEANSEILDDFIRYKQVLGFNVEVITEDEFGIETGKNRALNIRSWLIDHYTSDSIEYVLLIGNPDPDSEEYPDDEYGDIPMMMCWPTTIGDPLLGQAPTDYFYADLTGDWDSDGDGLYGEYGYNTGVDFAPEVYVGRIPVYDNDYSSLDFILNQTIYHHVNAGDEKFKILEPMAISNYAQENGTAIARSDSLNCPEEVFYGIVNRVGMMDTVLYEQEGLLSVSSDAFHYGQPLTRENVISEFNEGHGAIFWWGHGSYTGAYRKYWSSDDGDTIPEDFEMTWEPFINSSDMSQLENDQPSFVYQSSCLNGCPEISENLGYALLKRGAAIGTISASRVSYYVAGTWRDYFWLSFSDNTGIGYKYFENLLKKNMTNGEAIFLSKYLGGDSLGYGSWMNRMVFNLYGDPQIDYWGSAHPEIANPIPCDSLKRKNSDISLSVKVIDPDNDALNVAFYNATDYSLFCLKLAVPSGSTVTIKLLDIEFSKTYSWFVIISDGQVYKQSNIWNFSIERSVFPTWLMIVLPVIGTAVIMGIAVATFVFLRKKKKK